MARGVLPVLQPAGGDPGTMTGMIFHRPWCLAAVLACCLLGWPPASAADELPLWEAGFGVAPISFPEYRGAKTQRHYVLPLPYLIYRGKLVQVDRGGIRGLLLDREDFEIDLSVSGTVPVKSRGEGPRSGMPDLDPILEAGATISWLLVQGGLGRVRLRLPIRAAMATDLRSIHHVGWKADPHVHVEVRDVAGGWKLGVAVGPLFADRRYHDYYYAVDPAFATPERPVYQASGGYSGWSVLASASRRTDRLWMGAFLRYDNLDGARFTDSPLVETRHATMVGFGIAWILRQGRTTVSN